MLPPSARPEGQLTLLWWPGSFCPPPPILPSTQNALQRLLDNPHSLSESALEEFPSITYIV